MIETADISALREELVRRFRTTTRDLELAGRTIRLLMPANADELISEADFDRDYWMTAPEAKDYGLVDEVLLTNPRKEKKAETK